MTEKEYRIEKLRYKQHILTGKRIVIYGTGINAEEILISFPGLNILALMDEKHTGEYFYGKKVISEEEARLLKIEVIIIAAEAGSAYIVSERIRPFCIRYDIKLFNMYGYDEFELKSIILDQEIKYVDCSADELKRKIDKYEIVCFQLTDVLCAWSDFDKGYNAQELLERKIPKKRLIDIANWSVEQGKDIYIISELSISKKHVEELLDQLGIIRYKGIIQENLLQQTMSQGALRIGMGDDFGRKTFYIGTNEKINLLLPQLYDMDIYLLKNAWSIMRQFSGFLGMGITDDGKNNVINELVEYTFNSPFIKENNCIEARKVLISPKLKEKEKIGFPLPEFKEMKELELLKFISYDRPLVSIIIPAYNQFGYTYNCLKSILQNTEKVKYEVILADDCSTDETRFIEGVVQGIKIIRNKENLLFLRNCNQAGRYVRGKYILFLNNDTQVQSNWLLPLVRIMEENEEVGLAGSKLLYPDGSVQDAGGIIWCDGTGCNYGRGTERDDFECNYVREVDYVTGASMIIRTDLWKEIGGFDLRYSPAYCEDSDLAFEVRKRNKKVIYQPMSEVIHFEGISNGKKVNTGVKAYQEINTYKLKEKWKHVLEKENHIQGSHMLAVRDRKGSRKCVLFISNHIPKYDSDSKTVFSYLKLFLKKGYIVKLLPADFEAPEPYTSGLQQMGIEVLAGLKYKENIYTWILKNQKDIDYVLSFYTQCTYNFIRLLKCTTIKLRYYGLDSQFLKNQRDYRLTKDSSKLQLSEGLYEKEKYIVTNIEKVYYPLEIEDDILKNTLEKEGIKKISAYMYDMTEVSGEYKPDIREGIMFTGDFCHVANVEAVQLFADEIYPLIYEKKKIPFYIVGPNAPLEIRQLDTPGIIYKGHLADEELEKMYRLTKIAVFPLRSEIGVNEKIIEAMYQGIPVVTTRPGIEGIKQADKSTMIVDNWSTFAHKLLDLYMDEYRLKELSCAGQNVVGTYYSENVIFEKIKNDF